MFVLYNSPHYASSVSLYVTADETWLISRKTQAEIHALKPTKT